MAITGQLEQDNHEGLDSQDIKTRIEDRTGQPEQDMTGISRKGKNMPFL
jgi:hypothetical protein